jgi:hypothetical protein
MSIDVMKQALEALERGETKLRYEAITALRDRLAQPQVQPCAGRNCGSTNPNLHSAECFEDYEKSTGMAQPEQEPVAWMCYGASEKHDIDYFQDEVDAIPVGTQLYASPSAQCKPLTDDRVWLEYMQLWSFRPNDEPTLAKDILRFARAIEAAHGIKENT